MGWCNMILTFLVRSTKKFSLLSYYFVLLTKQHSISLRQPNFLLLMNQQNFFSE